MDFPTESEPENVDSSLWPHDFKLLAGILTEINEKVQSMLRLIEDGEPQSTEKFLCLYQSLGETYNDLNQELLDGLLKFDFKLSSSDQKSVSPLVASTSTSFKPDISSYQDLDLESKAFCSSPKHQLRRTTSSQLLQILKHNGEAEKNQSAFLFADIFCAELDIARRELEERNIDIETEKRRVVDLESKLLDSTYKVEKLDSELKVIKECLHAPEAEVSKLMEMLNEGKSEKAKLQTDNAADLLDNLIAELRSRDIQIEQMEEYLNQVCVRDTGIISESGIDKNTLEELRAKVEELEKQVEMQRTVITEREEEKREAIRQLCFSLDYYMKRYLELVRSLSDNKKVSLVK